MLAEPARSASAKFQRYILENFVTEPRARPSRPTEWFGGPPRRLKMRKSITIAIVAFVAGAASIWTLSNSGVNARYKLAGAVEHGINMLDLTMKAGAMLSQQFDSH